MDDNVLERFTFWDEKPDLPKSKAIKEQALEEKYLEAEKVIKEIRCVIDLLNCCNHEACIKRIMEIIHKTNIGAIGYEKV